MDAREENKHARRKRILEAALGLLQRGGAEALTMRELAKAAGVSERTPHNLFGSKGGVVEALLESWVAEVVDQSSAERPGDLLERLFLSTAVLADAWSAGAFPVRELMRCARESGADLTSFAEVPIVRLRAGLEAAASAGLINKDVPFDDLARQIHICNLGSYQLWLAGEVDVATLRRDLIAGLAIALLGVAKPAARARILEKLNAGRSPKRPVGRTRRR